VRNAPLHFLINTSIRNSVSHFHWLEQFKVFHKTCVGGQFDTFCMVLNDDYAKNSVFAERIFSTEY
jgi:hypothetical protein